MDAETLSMLVGVVVSILFSVVPGLKGWFEKKEPEVKRLIMLGVLAVVALAIAGIACAGFGPDLHLSVTCDRAGLIGLLRVFVLAVIANQATYMITPLFKSKVQEPVP